jgi:hypothetical protein
MNIWDWRLRAALRTLHGRKPGVDLVHRQRLENELAERFTATVAPRRRWTMASIMDVRTARWATVGLALALVVVACTAPTTSEVEMGRQIQMTLRALPSAHDPSLDLGGKIREMVDVLSARPEVDDVSVSMRERQEGTVELDLLVWGTGIDEDRILSALRERFPLLEDAHVVSRELAGQLRESFAEKVGRELLHLEVSGNTEDEIRQQILSQLAASGFEGDAHVHVEHGSGLTTIGVSIQGDGVETEDVIEIIGDDLPETVELEAGPHSAPEQESGEVTREVHEVHKQR